LMDGQSAAAKALLDEIAANLRDALTEATTLAQLIHPPLLAGRGLAAAVRSAAEDAGVTVLVDAPSDGDYPAGFGAVLYWTCVEALSSASPGAEATVSVRNENGKLAFEIAITGSHQPTSIQRLRDRIEAFDGRVNAETGAKGSQVHGWLPLSR
jgi:signal transduction histidine kinase